jgi:hypothetical protein
MCLSSFQSILTSCRVCLQRYSRLKAEHHLYDRPDLVHWIYSRLAAQGYSGCPVTHILRDEVQDFVQGELLLDGLVSCSPVMVTSWTL